MGRSRVVASSLFMFVVGCNSSGVLGESDPGPTPTPTAAPQGDVTFPQAIRGAMWANPELYATIPLHVRVNEALDASDVDVVVDGTSFDADYDAASGDFVAQVAIGALGGGAHAVEALVAADGETLSAEAQLFTGSKGVQLTEYGVDGPANTPRLHRVGDDLVVTWSDRSETAAIAWARTLDGAGNWTGSRTRLVTSALDTTAVRTATGAGTIGVLRQDLDPGPYISRFSVTDLAGVEILPAIDLVPEGTYGSWGGDVAWDDTTSTYVLVWRVNDGAGSSHIRWARVDPALGLVAGPVVVASPGNGAPHGGFSPQTVVGVRALEGKSLVSFTREYYDMTKTELVWVDASGNVGELQMPGTASDLRFHWEARVHELDGGLLATWVASPINDEVNPPATIHTSLVTEAGTTLPNGKMSITSTAFLSEPEIVAHPTRHAVAAWSDERAYVDESNPDAEIELWFTTLDAELESGEHTRIAHSRLYSQSSEVQAAPAGTNVILVWRDERTQLFEPELWFETLWY